MDTMVLERTDAAYLISSARIARTQDDLGDVAASTKDAFEIDKSSPFVTWITGDFVESDKPNRNTQMWTAGDLAIAEYSIKHAPLNMIHKVRQPVGFFAATKTIPLKKEDDAAAEDRLKIQALSGLWSHIFQFEAVQVEAASEAGLLFYSMECRGTHLICAGDNGCGETFEYAKIDTHCEHLTERSSIRHIVNPTFRGGALVVPPMRPGWAEANASILQDSVMQEAAIFADQNEAAYKSLVADGSAITDAAWEALMTQVVTLGTTT